MKKLLIAIVCLSTAALGVRAQDIINTNNTVVRFAFFNDGTNFGSIDVELFDQDKPQTVRNFLLYVYSGGYSNIFLQRVFPNFVMQAGRGRISDPTSTNKFTNYIATPTYGRITNEFSVGPVHSNEFGTLAMGRIGGLTNSAEAEWYFNLTNSPFLDTADGGYTVFGHVVNTTDERSGTNLLHYFSAFVRGQNISTIVTDTGDVLSDLPFATNRTSGVQFRDLFTMQVFVIQNAVPHADDTNAPIVTVLLPATTNVVVTNATFRMSGTASDNMQVARVYYVSEIFGRYVADGTTDWSAELTLLGGVNRFTVYSVDWRGNVSAPVERVIYRELSQPLDLRISGRGKVTGLTNGQPLKVGDTYTASAKASYDWLFIGWSVSSVFGDGFYTDNPLSFRMEEDTVVIANFAQPIAVNARGSYSGVFSPGTNGPSRSAGLISFTMAPNGSYSGRLAPLGASYQIRGRFGFDGHSQISGKLGTTTLTLDMFLLTNGFNRIVGTYSDGHFVSSILLFPVGKFASTNPPSQQGTYSFLLSPTLDTNSPVSGYGSGTLTVNARGKVKMSGTMADGATTVTRTTTLCRGGFWPFMGTARHGGGSVVGWAAFDTNGMTFDGNIKWFSPSLPGSTNQNIVLHGSKYVSPEQARLLNWTNGVVTLSGGGLNGTLTANVMLNEDGTFTIPSNPNNIQLNVAAPTGLLTGSFVYPGTLAVTPIKGAILQSSNIVAGFFQGTSGRGAIVIRGE